MKSRGVFVASLAPRPGGHLGVDNDAYYPALIDRVSAVPDVEKASLSLYRLASDPGGSERVSTAGERASSSTIESLSMSSSPGLFETLGIRVRAGRDFRWDDNSRSGSVAVVSESLARRLFPGGNPIGQHLRRCCLNRAGRDRDGCLPAPGGTIGEIGSDDRAPNGLIQLNVDRPTWLLMI